MRFNVVINQQKCIDYGVKVNDAALMELINQLASWAESVDVDGKIYYHISRGKVVDELPFFFRKPDTVYRSFKRLEELEMIVYLKCGNRDCVMLTDKGKGWNRLGKKSELGQNSEKNPSKLGKKSEWVNKGSGPMNTENLPLNSEKNPTYNIYNYTKDKREARAMIFLFENEPMKMEAWFMQNKSRITEWDDFVEHFEEAVVLEDIAYEPKKLLARLDRLKRNWLKTQERKKVIPLQVQEKNNHPSRKRIIG